ncbi:MAG: HD-GYP domain-containing protein [Gammaproteobacteria bacterium]|nr:HD-GYP domain-containing protein [Gammaproteobacteria bacterium]
MERKVHTAYLKTGMYIANLDRPWLDTPFLIQGFVIRGDDELQMLQRYCEFVYIDPERGAAADYYMDEGLDLPSNVKLERFLGSNQREVEYRDLKTVEQEIPVAKTALEDAADQIGLIMDDVRIGKNLNLEAVRGVVEPVLESIIRNPDALLWLSRLRQKDNYTYSHSVDNCALAIAFGRHLGLPRDDIRILAIGMLLLDIGKMKVPEAILNKASTLTEAEFQEVKRHVDYGVEILKNTADIDDSVIHIAMTHHERYDGSGYPNGIEGDQIPVYGRIAAIIDCYDAMTSKRIYSDAISPHNALQQIYNWRNKFFQDELVEQFLQCLGVYPTGSLVEMNSGEVGIVLSQNRTKRLKPRIMLLLDEDKTAYKNFKIIDLMTQAIDASGHVLNIHCAHDPGAFGIDPTEFYL